MKTITGLFESPAQAAEAIDTLDVRGVDASDISLVAVEGFNSESFGLRDKTKVAEGAAIGAGLGGTVGAIVAGFTLVGALATGGVGLVAAGPIVAALAGAGAGAAAGGAVGSAVGLAIPEHEIKHYQNAIEKGSVLVGVRCEDADTQAVVKDVFKASGAAKISHA